jgi:uncharacterized protein
MHVRTFSNPSIYLKRVRPVLEAQESANNLILGVILRLVEHPEWTDTPPLLALVEDERNQILLIAVQTPPMNILLSAPEKVTKEQQTQAVDDLVTYLLHSDWHFSGVNAEKSLSEQFAIRWSEASGLSYRVKKRLRIYELRQVTPPTNPPPGFMRTATPEDAALLARWHYAFEIEAMGEGDPEQSKTIIARRLPAGDLFIWDDNGPVSCAIRARPTMHSYTVSFVYTPPELRGRGYASTCVAALSQALLDTGKQFCNLFTDLDNPTSNSIYQKIGYRPVRDFTEYRFEKEG